MRTRGIPRSSAKAISGGEGCQSPASRDPRTTLSAPDCDLWLARMPARSRSSTSFIPSAMEPPLAKWSRSLAAIGAVAAAMQARSSSAFIPLGNPSLPRKLTRRPRYLTCASFPLLKRLTQSIGWTARHSLKRLGSVSSMIRKLLC